MTDTGRLTGSRERSQSSLSSPAGFDPGRSDLPCACGRTARPAAKFDHAEIRRIKRGAGSSEALAYIEELEGLLAYAKQQGNVWRGIAAAMGYEPNAHKDVRPSSTWLVERVAKFRAALTPPSEPTEK